MSQNQTYQALLRRFPHLAARHCRAAIFASEGLTNRQIAEELGTTEMVVKNYLREAYDILGVFGRVELAVMILKIQRDNDSF